MSRFATGLRRWTPVTVAHLLGIASFATIVTSAFVSAGSDISFLIVLGVTLVVGWVLAARLPRNPLGWLLIAFTVLFLATTPAALLGDAVAETSPELSRWLYWYGLDRDNFWAWLPPLGLLFTQVPLRFPDGKPPSRGWRWFSWFTAIAILASTAVFAAGPRELAPGVANPAYLPGAGDESLATVIFAALLAPSFIGSFVSLFFRYRRASDLQRAQIRWVLWATALVLVSLLSTWFLPERLDWLSQIVAFSYALIPIAIGVSVLRYRLYDIDRLISRTASYGLVSISVVAVYLLIVTSVHWLLPDLPAIGVAVATLAAAALFLPLLRWVRRLVDRRFDRERYHAEKVVDAFGEHLRTDLDPHSTSAELLAAVSATLQPTSAGLWTRGSAQ